MVKAHGVGAWIAGCALAGALVGCEREDVRATRVPKRASPPAGMHSAGSPADVPPAREVGGAAVVWDEPAGWEKIESSEATRVATYRVADAGNAEVSITAFPGDAGGPLANVNRWRGQVGLAPTDDAGLVQEMATTMVGMTKVSLVRLAGAEKTMLGAIVVPGDGKTWFVKSTLGGQDVARLRPSFEALARSIRLGGAGAEATSPHTPAGVLGRVGSFRAPEAWQKDERDSNIVTLAYNTAGGARVTLTALGGAGGGVLANVNRWRGQMGLEPGQDLASAGAKVGAGGEVGVDLTSADSGQRLRAVIVPEGSQSWYFKISGPSAEVAAHAAEFDRLVLETGGVR